MTFYERKAKEYHALWEAAIDSGDTKAADKYMFEYNNYLKMSKG